MNTVIEISENEILQRYLEISQQYNLTPLAVNNGWVYSPNEFQLLQIKMLCRLLPKNGILIDIGTGHGIVPRFFKSIGVNVITIDSKEVSGKQAIENARLAGIEGRYCNVEHERLPFPNGFADCVLFADVIEHLIHSPKTIIDEIYRVLKNGGVCLATTPNATRLTVRVKMLLGYSNWPLVNDYFYNSYHSGHHHEYTKAEFVYVFTECGFEYNKLIMKEHNLCNTNIGSISNLHSKKRAKIETEPIYIKIGKYILIVITNIFPSLRSSMILILKKPG